MPWELKEMVHWVSAIKISMVSRTQDQSVAVQMRGHSKMCDETAERNVPALSVRKSDRGCHVIGWSYWLAASPRSSWTARGSRSPRWPRDVCRQTLGRWGSRTAQVAHWRTPSSGRSTSRRPPPDSSPCTGPLAPLSPSATGLCGRQD